MVKPVAPILRGLGFYAGNTILGDGSVIMILDPNGIAAAKGGLGRGAGGADGRDGARRRPPPEPVAVPRRARELKAVPLGAVARLEEIDLARWKSRRADPSCSIAAASCRS